MTPSPIHDELWTQLRAVAEAEEKLCGSPPEWKEAFLVWRTLDPFQKQKAIEYLRENDGMQVTHVTPVKYLRMQIFLRPTPKARAQKPAQPDAAGVLARLKR